MKVVNKGQKRANNTQHREIIGNENKQKISEEF